LGALGSSTQLNYVLKELEVKDSNLDEEKISISMMFEKTILKK
jgi:hypothetical protein